MKKTPRTDEEFEETLQDLGYEVIDHDSESFTLKDLKSLRVIQLDADTYTGALVEAYALVK